MNKLTLKIADAESEDGSVYSVVYVIVDGTSLIDLARQAERPFATREGHSSLAGAYAWIPVSG